MIEKVYINNVKGLVRELSDRNYQTLVWLNTGAKPGMSISFIEAVNMLFDDSAITYLLEKGEIIVDKKVTRALRELDNALEPVDEFRPTLEIINDPLMEVVREKAAKALELIEASDGSESTVEIIE